MIRLHHSFPKYSVFSPRVPVHCVTPGRGRVIHRFFDTSPFSPSGRFMALTRLPAEDRRPEPGESAEVVLVDLETSEERAVAETRGWDTQLGAQVQWGRSDAELYYNDLDPDTWDPHGVQLNPNTLEKRRLSGTVYMVSPDGKSILSTDLKRIGAIQPGYGVRIPEEFRPRNLGAPEDDGVYLTDLETGECRLLVSIRQIVETCIPAMEAPDYAHGAFYCFHVKWNPQAVRILLVLRWVPDDPSLSQRSMVVTMSADGTGIRLALPAEIWGRGGHHPNWNPDGETILMNLRFPTREGFQLGSRLAQILGKRIAGSLGIRDDGMRFARFRFDGADPRLLSSEIVGSGHPSKHVSGRYMVTDAYPHDLIAYGDGTVPIRLIDLEAEQDFNLIRMMAAPPYTGLNNELRLDPHPAWDRDFKAIAFNGFDGGTRRVYVADLSSILE